MGILQVVRCPRIARLRLADRIWRVHNILIQFDSNDIVSDWVIISDNDLDKHIDLLDERADFPLNLPRALQVDPICHESWQPSSTLSLREGFIEYTTPDSSLTTERRNIDKLASGNLTDTKVELYAKLHFSVPVETRYVMKKQKAYKTRRLEVILNPADYLLLRRYLRQTTHTSQSAGN
jgi:hypothetical protein